METLRGFVEAVLTKDDRTYLPEYWSKPDDFSESFELRRYSAPARSDRPRTDFFEFYWQHLMQGNRLSHIYRWARSLLLRKPSNVPAHLRPLWWLSWIVASIAVVVAAAGGITALLTGSGLAWILPGLSAVGLVLQGFLISHVADAARYLDPSPDNVPCRQMIRSAGIKLLENLHEREKYNRIVVVGHSLGSVIGYDVLQHLWARYNDRHSSPATPKDKALKELEAVARKLRDDPASKHEDLAKLQRAYGFELLENGNPWLVTDFITLGSPLAHAELLLADNSNDFERQQRRREIATCLPFLEYGKVFSRKQRYKTVLKENGKTEEQDRIIRSPHFAAVFAPVRWTNIYFPSRFIFDGDVISGPLADTTEPPSRRFGPAIRDIAVRTNAFFGLLSHTRYWREHEADARLANAPVPTLRAALALDDKPNWKRPPPPPPKPATRAKKPKKAVPA